jgi:hypothetical protein
MKFNIKKPELPPEGNGSGVIVDVVSTKVKRKRGGVYDAFKLVIELATTKKDGRRFYVEKTYTLDGGGITRLQKALKDWRGGKEVGEAELENFDPEAEYLSKTCLAPIAIVHEDGKPTAHVGTLVPNEPALVASGDYKRQKPEVAE